MCRADRQENLRLRDGRWKGDDGSLPWWRIRRSSQSCRCSTDCHCRWSGAERRMWSTRPGGHKPHRQPIPASQRTQHMNRPSPSNAAAKQTGKSTDRGQGENMFRFFAVNEWSDQAETPDRNTNTLNRTWNSKNHRQIWTSEDQSVSDSILEINRNWSVMWWAEAGPAFFGNGARSI